jgi:hypothetical protein
VQAPQKIIGTTIHFFQRLFIFLFELIIHSFERDIIIYILHLSSSLCMYVCMYVVS